LLALFILKQSPELFSNYVNHIPANPNVTPSHIIPEWYLLPFYGSVKAIPSKVFGVIYMLLFILFPLSLPFFSKPAVNK
jgi:ubiquinol-cytochrome c reductase cytochrome b subunit